MKRFFTLAVLLLPALFACTGEKELAKEGATNVVLSKDKVDIMVGETASITATVLPEALKMKVIWSVLDTEYAEVKDGAITGKSEGVTYVIATSADGKKKAACMVSVNPPIKYSVSVQDEYGNTLDGIYGYPGMSLTLSAVTSDGESGHRFSWSVEDASVATVDSGGQLTFGSVKSNDFAFVYDAQSYLRVVSEDGYGCKIPVRSSIVKGVKVGEDVYMGETPVVVQQDERYLLSMLYQGAEDPAEIPAGALELELSNSTDFSLMKTGDTYTLVTGSASAVSTTLSFRLPSSSEKIDIAEFKIDKVYPIRAELAAVSSSTLSFTWTEGISAEDDISKPYTISLYKDENGNDLLVSYSIPAGADCWRLRQPRFVFSGLEQNTTYWFRVVDTNGEEGLESALISGTTAAFNIVEPGSEAAAVGDVLLAEDFSELLWAADETTLSAGFDVGSDSSSSFSNREADSFVGTTGQYAQRIITGQTTAKKESGLRIGRWAQGQYARLYVGPGYVFLSTKSYGTHLITPTLDNIPEDKTATVKVTLHAAGYASGNNAVLAVQHGKSFNNFSSGTQTNKQKVNLTDNIQTITFKGGISQLDEFSVTLEGLVKGDRIAFGPTSETAAANTNMMLISDMTIELVEIK